MASTSSRISRRKKKSSKLLVDFRHEFAQRRVVRFRNLSISVIGDEETGRHTLVRRFLDMNGGPFQQPENRRVGERDILVDLNDRQHVIGRGIVCLKTSIYNLQDLNFETIFQTIARKDAFVVIFDVGRSITLLTAIQCMVKIFELLRRYTPEFILVGNKIDLAEREISTDRGREVAKSCKAESYYDCSALMNVNMDAVLNASLIMALDQFLPLPR